MLRRISNLCIILIAIPSFATAATAPAPAKLTADQIVQRNVAARGGAQAWQAVQSMVMTGKMEAGGNRRPTLPMPGAKEKKSMPQPRPVEQAQLPFMMELKRPKKMRVEVQFNGQTAIQVFDGNNGWKLRPFLNRKEVEVFTEEELKASAAQFELDGPLVNYRAKGTTIELESTDVVEEHPTYKLKLTTKTGQELHLWIDATTFLETKIEGTPRKMDGKNRPVEIYYHDFREVNGLQVPFVLETKLLSAPSASRVAGVAAASEKIFLDKVQVNPVLEDALFTRAELENTASGKKTTTSSMLVKP